MARETGGRNAWTRPRGRNCSPPLPTLVLCLPLPALTLNPCLVQDVFPLLDFSYLLLRFDSPQWPLHLKATRVGVPSSLHPSLRYKERTTSFSSLSSPQNPHQAHQKIETMSSSVPELGSKVRPSLPASSARPCLLTPSSPHRSSSPVPPASWVFTSSRPSWTQALRS